MSNLIDCDVADVYRVAGLPIDHYYSIVPGRLCPKRVLKLAYARHILVIEEGKVSTVYNR